MEEKETLACFNFDGNIDITKKVKTLELKNEENLLVDFLIESGVTKLPNKRFVPGEILEMRYLKEVIYFSNNCETCHCVSPIWNHYTEDKTFLGFLVNVTNKCGYLHSFNMRDNKILDITVFYKWLKSKTDPAYNYAINYNFDFQYYGIEIPNNVTKLCVNKENGTTTPISLVIKKILQEKGRL